MEQVWVSQKFKVWLTAGPNPTSYRTSGGESMKRVFIASAAVASLFAVTSASAADLPVYPKAVPVAVYDWTGFYIGTNVGYSWGRATTNGTYTGTQRVTNTQTVNAQGVNNNAIISDVITPLAGGVFSGQTDMKGFVGGGQFGYNWQAGSFLYGLEADIQGSGERGRVSLVPTGLAPPFLADYTLNWFGTARGRVGFLAAERLSLYATGGLAYGGFSGGSPTLAYSFSSVKAGWTVGAGAEAALGSNWSIKFEYLYMDLGNVGNISATWANSSSSTYGSANSPPRGTILTQTAYTYLFNSKFTDNIVRVGFNYKFGGPAAVVARY
jgi:outer membrane immunogenic protein